MRAALASGGKLEVPTLEEQALYHNLCILGIIHPGLKQEGIELSRTAFRRSNNKALEYVLYRLYIIIEGKSRAQKDFKGMLPVLDKLQQAPFYQRIGDWMAELKKSGRLEPSVILPVSALKTNTSNRLILLLLELSTVALYQDAEAACQGIGQGSSIACGGSVGSGAGGLLDDPLVPAEVRLGVSTTRAKQACSEFLAAAASASSICDAMEQRSLAFKKSYYELQAEIRQQHVVMAELPEGTLVTSSSQEPMNGSPRSSAPNANPDSLQTRGAGVLNGLGTSQQPPTRWNPPRGLPNPEKAEALASLLAGLDEHLRVHKELSEALMTDGRDMDGSNGSSNAATAIGRIRASGLAIDSTGLRFGQSSSQQVLHPYQIDGRALATEALVAAATAAGSDPGARVGSSGPGLGGFEQQPQRRQQKNMLMPYGPDNIVKAFMSFASLLSSLAPHVTQLAMAGENAGPPPLLQPPSHPSGHAAHVAHQLQVHGTSSRQIAQLSRKAQEQSAAYGPALRALRLESSRAISHRCDFSNHDCLDDDFLDMGPHLALPPVLPGNSVRQISAPLQSMGSSTPQASAPPGGLGATGASSGAPSVVVMGSPCPSSADAYGATTAQPSSASGCGSADVAAPTAKVIATSTTAEPADDGLAKIHARLRNLNIAQPSAGGMANTGFTGPSLGTAAPVSATSARANTVMSIFSPSGNVQMTGASPKSSTAAGPARPPLSTTTHSPHYLPVYAPVMTGSTINPLQSVAELQQQHGMLGNRHSMFMQPPLMMKENGKGASGFTGAGHGSSAWGQMPWLGGSASSGAPGAPTAAVQASTVSQAWAAGFRGPSSSVVAPGWVSPQPLSQLKQQQPEQQSVNVQHDTATSSRRDSDAFFRQQSHQPCQQQQQCAADGDGLLSVPALERRRVIGAVGSSGGMSHTMQRLDAFRSAESIVSETHRATLDCSSGAGAPSKLVCDVMDGTSSASGFGAGSNAETSQPVAETKHCETSSGRWAPGETHRVDLCSLLDDDDDDKGGAHFLGGYRETRLFNGGLPDAPLDSSDAAAGFTAAMGFSPSPSEGRQIGATVNSSSKGALHADNDADFGLLAAEGELVSQALMLGGSAANAAASLNPHMAGQGITAATVHGSVPATLFGAPMAEASNSAWGSCGGVAMMDVGDHESERAPVGGGVLLMTSAHGGFGPTESDGGDDVVMADNNKDLIPGFSTKGISGPAGWLCAGLGAQQGGQVPKGNNLFDDFGALMSPPPPQQLPGNSGVTAPVVTAASSGFGAEILALKARMQAAMTKQ